MADDLDPRETERLRRRDREAESEHRDLMRPGMGKVFKQIQDAQARAAKSGAAAPKAGRSAGPKAGQKPGPKAGQKPGPKARLRRRA